MKKISLGTARITLLHFNLLVMCLLSFNMLNGQTIYPPNFSTPQISSTGGTGPGGNPITAVLNTGSCVNNDGSDDYHVMCWDGPESGFSVSDVNTLYNMYAFTAGVVEDPDIVIGSNGTYIMAVYIQNGDIYYEVWQHTGGYNYTPFVGQTYLHGGESPNIDINDQDDIVITWERTNDIWTVIGSVDGTLAISPYAVGTYVAAIKPDVSISNTNTSGSVVVSYVYLSYDYKDMYLQQEDWSTVAASGSSPLNFASFSGGFWNLGSGVFETPRIAAPARDIYGNADAIQECALVVDFINSVPEYYILSYVRFVNSPSSPVYDAKEILSDQFSINFSSANAVMAKPVVTYDYNTGRNAIVTAWESDNAISLGGSGFEINSCNQDFDGTIISAFHVVNEYLTNNQLIPSISGRISIQNIYTLHFDEDQSDLFFEANAILTTNLRQAGSNQSSVLQSGIDDRIVVYPNPFSNNFSITSKKPLKGIMMTDISGKTVFNKDFENFDVGSQVEFMPDKNLPSGIYLLKVRAEDEFRFLKLTKE